VRHLRHLARGRRINSTCSIDAMIATCATGARMAKAAISHPASPSGHAAAIIDPGRLDQPFIDDEAGSR
jgi:hypothetical protein